MKVASVADVKAHFSAYLKASQEGPVVVTRNGKPVAVLLAAGDEEELERLLMVNSPKLQAILDAARERFRLGAGIPHEVFWQEVEKENASRSKRRDGMRKVNRTKR
jgi:prevent-host-death family protein